MIDNDGELRPSDAALDALLRERIGQERAPDLSSAVAERHARGEGAAIAARLAEHDDPAGRGPTRALWVAALLLLGLSVVASSIWALRDGKPGSEQERELAIPRPDLQQPSPQDAVPANAASTDPQGEPIQDPKKPIRAQNQRRVVRPPRRAPATDLEFLLRVLDERGGPIQDCVVEVVPVEQADPLRLRPATVLKDVAIEPRDFEGEFATIAGLPKGRFVVVVDDGIHAKSTSPPFSVDKDTAPKVTVRMNRGGSLRGIVVDSNGRPVKGATVSTLAPWGEGASNPFSSLIQDKFTSLHTLVNNTTDAEGRFTLEGLALGRYAVRVRHSEFAPTRLRGVGVVAEPKQPIQLVLQQGSGVHGCVTKNGAPLVGWIVRVEPVVESPTLVSGYTARTNQTGQFRLDVRLAPGRYRIGCRDGARDNPLVQIQQFNASSREFDIDDSGGNVEQKIDIK